MSVKLLHPARPASGRQTRRNTPERIAKVAQSIQRGARPVAAHPGGVLLDAAELLVLAAAIDVAAAAIAGCYKELPKPARAALVECGHALASVRRQAIKMASEGVAK